MTHRVVIVGGGFGGLQAALGLRKTDVEITLVDRRNFHLFQPLTYQVATGALSPGEVAYPLRAVFKRNRNVRVVLAEVGGFDLDRREVILGPVGDLPVPGPLPYDTLIVAGGSHYSYFGHDEWSAHAAEVKSLESALTVRGRILSAFEGAELERDPELREEWLTFAVVGAGPTGVEMAGQIAELANDTLPRDFRTADPGSGRILLIEAADRVLTGFPPSLSAKAERSLRRLGVTPLLDSPVVDVDESGVTIREAGEATRHIPARTVVWAAGVTASALAKMLAQPTGAEQDAAGRVTVEADLTLPGHPEVLALGDMVRVRDRDGAAITLPGVAPVAMQQGRYAAKSVKARVDGRTRPPFRYRDKGNLATIGRAAAVADIRGIKLSGFLAWMTWLVVHLFYLIGFQNRLLVLIRWSFGFVTRGRGTRLITGGRPAIEHRNPNGGPVSTRHATEILTYDVFVNDPPPQDDGLLPNGEPKQFSPQASTLIHGSEDAVLTDPPMTTDQARVLGDWVAAKGRNVTDIFITHGHGDHWFAAGPLAERFNARVVASAGTIAQMHANVAMRPLLWDKVYQGIPPTPVTAVTVPENRFLLEGHELVIVEVGTTDSDDTTVLHVPDLGLVVAGDVIYNGVHMYLAQGAAVGGFGPWRDAIDKVEALGPRHIIAGHQNSRLDDDAERTIAETRRYLDDAEELLRTETTAVDFFNAKIERYPNHLGRTILWVGARTLYGVREDPGADIRQISLNSWL